MKLFKTYCTLILLLGLSSCAFHSGMMNDSASLHGQDFELIGMAVGQASTTHVLGIGGLDPAGLVFDAKREMYTRFPLKKGQAYANLSVDFKRSYFLIVATTKTTVSADIVQFGEMETDSLQELFQNNLEFAYHFSKDNSEILGIMLNGELIRVSVLNKTNNDRYTLIDQNGKVYGSMSQFLIFQMKKGYTTNEINFGVGDQVGFKEDQSTLIRGMVVGISSQVIAVKAGEKTYQVMDKDIFEVVK